MLTGKQLKAIRQVADFTGTEVADEMFVKKQTISAIETGKTTEKSSIHYYELALKSMIERISDCELRSLCQMLFDKYSKINGDDEDFPVIDKLDESMDILYKSIEREKAIDKLDESYDVDDAWYVVIEYDDEPMDILYKSIEREKAIDYARELKERHPYDYIKVYHDFDY